MLSFRISERDLDREDQDDKRKGFWTKVHQPLASKDGQLTKRNPKWGYRMSKNSSSVGFGVDEGQTEWGDDRGSEIVAVDRWDNVNDNRCEQHESPSWGVRHQSQPSASDGDDSADDGDGNNGIDDNNCGAVDDNEDEEKEEYLEDPASARCIRPGHSDFMWFPDFAMFLLKHFYWFSATFLNPWLSFPQFLSGWLIITKRILSTQRCPKYQKDCKKCSLTSKFCRSFPKLVDQRITAGSIAPRHCSLFSPSCGAVLDSCTWPLTSSSSGTSRARSSCHGTMGCRKMHHSKEKIGKWWPPTASFWGEDGEGL